MFKEYKNFDATGLAELLEKKEITPGELLDEAIFQTEILDPLINRLPLDQVVPQYFYRYS